MYNINLLPPSLTIEHVGDGFSFDLSKWNISGKTVSVKVIRAGSSVASSGRYTLKGNKLTWNATEDDLSEAGNGYLLIGVYGSPPKSAKIPLTIKANVDKVDLKQDVKSNELQEEISAVNEILESAPQTLFDGVESPLSLRSYCTDNGITTWKYFNNTGAIVTNTYVYNDIMYAPVTPGTRIRIYKQALYYHAAYSKWAFFADAALTSLISVQANADSSTTINSTVTVPAGANYVAVNYSVGNNETYPEIYLTSAFDPQTVTNFMRKMFPLKDKRIWVFGDSQPTLMRSSVPSTQEQLDAQDWNTLKAELLAASVNNFSIIGATVHDKGNYDTDTPSATNTEYLTNLWRWAKRLYDAHTISAPDVVMLWMGGNSAYDSPVAGLTNYSTVMGLSYADLISAGYKSTRNTIYGGLRFWFESVKRTFPDAQIVVFGPAQTSVGSAINYTNLIAVRDAIQTMSKRYSARFVNLTDEIGVVDLYETSGASGQYFSDGLHFKSTKKAFARHYVSKNLEAAYFEKM